MINPRLEVRKVGIPRIVRWQRTDGRRREIDVRAAHLRLNPLEQRVRARERLAVPVLRRIENRPEGRVVRHKSEALRPGLREAGIDPEVVRLRDRHGAGLSLRRKDLVLHSDVLHPQAQGGARLAAEDFEVVVAHPQPGAGEIVQRVRVGEVEIHVALGVRGGDDLYDSPQERIPAPRLVVDPELPGVGRLDLLEESPAPAHAQADEVRMVVTPSRVSLVRKYPAIRRIERPDFDS